MSLTISKIDLQVDFVKKTVDILRNRISRYPRVIFISANKRLVRFVEKELDIGEILKIDFYTLEEFVQKIAIDFADIFSSYHCQVERDIFFLDIIKELDNKELFEHLGGSESKVFVWARRLSRLFDEIDRQGLEERLENFEYVEAIEPAQNILRYLKDLYKLYEDRYKAIGFNGRFFKAAASIVKEDRFIEQYKDSLFVFAGFLFLTNTELKILKALTKLADTLFLIHTDLLNRDCIEIDGQRYSFDSFEAVNRAIKLLTKNIPEAKIEPFADEVNNPKEPFISLYECSNIHFEASSIANKVKEISNSKDLKEIKDPRNIAIILPDSKTLFPLLSFMGDVPYLNVTMGFPLSQTDLGMFLESLFLLIINLDKKNTKEQQKQDKIFVSTTLLLRFLNNKLSKFLVSKFNIARIKSDIFRTGSSVYYFSKDSPLYKDILVPFLSARDFNTLYKAFMNLADQFDFQSLSKKDSGLSLQIIQLFYSEVVNSLKDIEVSDNIALDPVFIYHLIRETIDELSIPFEGHPLEGVQIMGMLEARMLSFNHLFIPDVNESILPYGDKVDPLLPEEIKRAIGLTSFKEKEQLIKYYFFRLIYSCKNVFIFYRSPNTNNAKASKSRFIEQLILLKEIKKEDIPITKQQLRLPAFKKGNNYIEKDKETIAHFKDIFTTPSLIDLYLSCPYKYYLSKIKHIPEKVAFEKDFHADKVGTLIHFIFENFFGEFRGKYIDKDCYIRIKENILKTFDNFFDQMINRLKNDKLKNYFINLPKFHKATLVEILRFRFKEFFDNTLTSKQQTFPFKILYVEKKLIHPELNLFGIIDRIDMLENGDIRIIDYKTGRFPYKIGTLDDINIDQHVYDDKNLEKIKEKIKLFQIPLYFLIAKKCFSNCNIKVLIYNFSLSSSDIIQCFDFDDAKLDIINNILLYILNHMQNSNYIYALPGESCNICNYKHFCKFSSL